MDIICKEIKKNGHPCDRKAKYGDKCGYHKPDGFHKKHLIPPKNNDEISDLIDQLSQLKIYVEKLEEKLCVKLDKLSDDLHHQSAYNGLD